MAQMVETQVSSTAFVTCIKNCQQCLAYKGQLIRERNHDEDLLPLM